jgi:hypothetical protein
LGGSIKGTGEIVTTVVDTVSGTLVSTIKGTGAVGTSARVLVRCAVT